MRRSRSRLSLLSLIVVAGMVAVPAGLIAPTAAQALTAAQRLDLRALVVVSGNPGCDYTVDALETAMNQEGVPYTEVNLSNATRPIITDAFLSTTQPSGVAEGFYNSVFMTNDNPFTSFCLTTPDATAAAEMLALTNYETTFGVRQVDSYTFPGASVGLTSAFEGSLDGAQATVTAAGLTGPFSYLNGPLPLDNYDPAVSEDYGYVATPAPAAGQTYTSFVNVPVPGGTTTGSLAGVFSDGTRQQLVLTFLANANQTYFRALTHGIITWATNGVHLGYSRNYFSVVVDDLFSDDSQWSTTGKCTPGEDCPIGSTITTPNIRMVPADVTAAATWEAANNFRFTFAFNGEASDSLTGALPGQAANTAGLVDDPLTDALLADKADFNWINHTYSHLHLGCVQNITVRPWVCETTDGQPVNCPSAASCNILWQTAAAIEPEITNNILFAQANGITVDPSELVSGEYSGLYYIPQEPIDNPNFITALNATGVKVTAADASRQFTTRPVGNAITSPRYPMSLWYNVDTVASEIDEYNYLYASPADGGGGFCLTNPAIVTCLPAALGADGFTNYIVPTETRMDLSHIMTNDPRPHYIHQPNFTGDRIVYPVMDKILGTYKTLYGATAPIINPTETDAANIEVEQQAWQNTAPTAVSAYLQNGNVTVGSTDGTTHNVPITVSPGTTVNGAAFGTAYAGDLSGWLSAKGLTAQTISFTAPATGTVGTSATLTATGGASGNPVVFTVDPSTTAGVCNVSGATLNYTAAGTCVVDANQAGNTTYAPATQVQQSISVLTPQTITFTAPASGTVGTPATLTATGGASGNPVVFSVDSSTAAGVCNVTGTNGSTLNYTAAGTCVVDANQAGNTTFAAAPQVQGSVTVTALTAQAITFTAPASGTVGTPATLTATGGASGNPVVFTVDASTAAGVCNVTGTNGSTLNYTAAGTCVVDANQAGNATFAQAPQVQGSVTVVALTPQTITFTAPASGTIGTSAPLTATGGASGNPVVFKVDSSTAAGVCNASGSNGSTLNYTAVGTCVVDANQAGNATFAAAPQVQRSITVTAVTKTNQTITFAALPNRTGAQSPVTVTATVSSLLAVTFTTTTASVCTAGGTNGATITLVAAGTCTVVANQAGNTLYNAAPAVTRSFTVTKANQNIAFGATPNRTLAQSPETVNPTASSGLVVTVTTTTPAVCTAGGTNGKTITLRTIGTCTLVGSQAGNAVFNAAATVTRSFTVSKANQNITFAVLAARSRAQGPVTVSATASSGLAVTFTTTTPTICTAGGTNGKTITLVAVGRCIVVASQAGNTSYNAANPITRRFRITA